LFPVVGISRLADRIDSFYELRRKYTPTENNVQLEETGVGDG
jgi:hypothetical protein